MFKKTTGDDDHQDKPEDHGGRQRSFAHQRGNWASFVYAEGETIITLPLQR